MEMIFYPNAVKAHFHKKGCALVLILKVRIFLNLKSSLFWVYLICKGKLLYFFCFRITLLWLTLCQFHNYMEIEVWFLLVISFEMRIAWLVARVLVRLMFQKIFLSQFIIIFSLLLFTDSASIQAWYWGTSLGYILFI